MTTEARTKNAAARQNSIPKKSPASPRPVAMAIGRLRPVCAGSGSGGDGSSRGAGCMTRRLDLHELMLFALEHLVDLGDEAVGELLQLLLRSLALVLGD